MESISIYRKHTKYNCHVKLDGRRRFFSRFVINFDPEIGMLYFNGKNRKGTTSKSIKFDGE